MPTKQELLYDCCLEHLEVGPDGNVPLAPGIELVFLDETVMLRMDQIEYVVHCADDLVDTLDAETANLQDHILDLEAQIAHIEQASKVVRKRWPR